MFNIQFSSVIQSCLTLCHPMNHSTLGLPVHHQLPEFTQTHVHRVSDAIQPSHPQLSPFPPAPNPSLHQSLFQWVNSLHEGRSIGVSASASVLPMNITPLVFTYLIMGSLCIFTILFHFPMSPPLSLVTKNLFSFSMSFGFAFWILPMNEIM